MSRDIGEFRLYLHGMDFYFGMTISQYEWNDATTCSQVKDRIIRARHGMLRQYKGIHGKSIA
jgi:hypothetical protein